MRKCVKCHKYYKKSDIVAHMRYKQLCSKCLPEYKDEKDMTHKMRLFVMRNTEEIVLSMVKNAKDKVFAE